MPASLRPQHFTRAANFCTMAAGYLRQTSPDAVISYLSVDPYSGPDGDLLATINETTNPIVACAVSPGRYLNKRGNDGEEIYYPDVRAAFILGNALSQIQTASDLEQAAALMEWHAMLFHHTADTIHRKLTDPHLVGLHSYDYPDHDIAVAHRGRNFYYANGTVFRCYG